MTNTFLKDCLADSFFKLLKERNLENISIQELVDCAGYHRSSWFRNFKSKHEAVTYKMVRLWEQYCELHNVPAPYDFCLEQAEAFFQYNYEIRDITRMIYQRGLMDDLCASFTSILHERHRDDPQKAYQTAIFAFSLYGILREWIIRDFDWSPDEMAIIIRRAIAHMT